LQENQFLSTAYLPLVIRLQLSLYRLGYYNDRQLATRLSLVPCNQ